VEIVQKNNTSLSQQGVIHSEKNVFYNTWSVINTAPRHQAKRL